MKSIAKLYQKFDLSGEEEKKLVRLLGTSRRIERKTTLVHEDQMQRNAYLILQGWIFSSKQLADGGRQVLHILTPGEFAGLRGLFLPASDRDVETLSDVVVVDIPREKVFETLQWSNRLMRVLLWTFAREEAIAAQHLTNLGRRSALSRTVHLLLELRHKLGQIGQADPSGFDCPLTQALLADALGITDTHLNRVFRELREGGLLNFGSGRVDFLNLRALQEISGFESSYLEPEGWRA